MSDPVFPELGTMLINLLRSLLMAVVTLLVLLVIGRGVAWLIWRAAHERMRLYRGALREQRSRTIYGLTRSVMNAVAVLLTVLLVLARFISLSSLATTVGLFSAGLGFAARPFISDVLSGIQLLLRDQFSIGEKVEIGEPRVIGVVERVLLTVTYLRGEAGELWIVPNGDVRTIRNFSRGSFSPANVRLTVPTERLGDTLVVLQSVIAAPGADIIEPPEVISEAGEIGETTVLLLKVKAAFGLGPQVRRALLLRLERALNAEGIIGHTQLADVSHEEPHSHQPLTIDHRPPTTDH